MRLITILPVALAMSCTWGYDEQKAKRTFNDGVVEMSQAFCEARVTCGWDVPESIPECVEYNVTNLCETRYECDRELTKMEEGMFDACVEDLGTFNCGPFLPSSCYAVLELR